MTSMPASAQESLSSPLDIVKCIEGQEFLFGDGIRSIAFKTQGQEGNACHVLIHSDLEGTYTIYDCLIPKDFPGQAGAGKIGSSDFGSLESKFCKLTKTGNVFLDEKSPNPN